MQSQILLTNTNDNTIKGPLIRVDGWYGRFNHVYTVSIAYSNFVGNLRLQATLAETPVEEDFFDVYPPILAGTYSQIVNFTGNFSWIRAIVSKTSGSVDQILINQGL